MAVRIVGKNPKDVEKYRKFLHERGHNTKRANHPVYRNKPEDYRTFQTNLKMVRVKGEEEEEDQGNEQGTVSEDAGFDPKAKLMIAGMANANIVDRMDERVDPRGGEFTNFFKNPVLLADHMYWTSSVVGRVEEVTPEDTGTSFIAEVGDPTKGPLTREQEECRSLIAQGYIKTVSIGFIPTKIQAPTYDDQGKLVDPPVILEWELLEISLVAIPANPDATFEMKQQAEKHFTLNANHNGDHNGLTTGGSTGKNKSSSNNPQTGPAGSTKGLDTMDEEQIKELLEGIKGLGTGLSALADAQKSSNEMLTETLSIIKGKGDDEDDDKMEEEDEDEDEDKEKRLKAVEDAVKEMQESSKQTNEIVVRLAEKLGLTDED